jgi:hypothetical protein
VFFLKTKLYAAMRRMRRLRPRSVDASVLGTCQYVASVAGAHAARPFWKRFDEPGQSVMAVYTKH